MNTICRTILITGFWVLLCPWSKLAAQTEVDTMLMVALKIQQAYELEGSVDSYLFEKAERILQARLKEEPNSKMAVYNLSVLYYNEGVQLLALSNQSGLKSSEISKFQDHSKHYFDLYEPLRLKYAALVDEQ